MTALVDQAQAAVVSALAGRFVQHPDFYDLVVEKDAVLPAALPRLRLNVVKGQRPPEILSEMMGLGEGETVTDFVQIFHVEWIVHEDDQLLRNELFGAGLEAIAAASADPTLGGVARGCTIAPPDYENQHLANVEAVSAVVVPLRVVLRGKTLLG
jgi:hypothetical protein